jgi:hypothetical protein
MAPWFPIVEAAFLRASRRSTNCESSLYGGSSRYLGPQFGPHGSDLMDKGKVDRVCASDSMSLDVQVA